MRGEAILRLTLIESICADNPKISAKELQDTVQSYECNSWLASRYQALTDAGNLPKRSPRPCVSVHVDADEFEAWVCKIYDGHRRDLHKASPHVLKAVGYSN
jgi:hypothetical protein